MRSDLAHIIDTIGSVLPKVVVVTNGISLSSEVVAAARDVGAEFKFSVHRPDSSNDDVYRVKSFGKILESMEACSKSRIRFSIHTVVTSSTVDLMGPMAAFALSCGARKISFLPVVPRGRAVKGEENSIGEDSLRAVRADVALLADDFKGRLDVRCVDFWSREYWVIENDGTLWIERSSEKLDERVCGLSELLAP